MIHDPDLAQRLDGLADRINRNGLSRVDPERFHAEKSDIAATLRRIARRLRGEPAASASRVWRAPGR